MKRIFLSSLLLLLSALAWGDGLRYDPTVASPAADISVQNTGTGISYHKLTWTLSAAAITTCNIQLDSSVDGTTWTAGGVIASLDCHAANGVTAVTSGAFNYVRINVTAVSGGNVSVVWNGYVTQPSGGGSVTQIVASSPLSGGTCTTTCTIGVGTLVAGSNGLAASATTDATNASNISTGTLNIARLGTLAAGSNGLATSATTDTTNASNISSGTLNIARLGTLASGSNGLAASATTDATNAANIASGSLPAARITTAILPFVLTDANTVEQYNSTTAQVHNIYGTRTDASNYERLRIQYVSGDAYYEILPEALGTGTARGVCLGTTTCKWGTSSDFSWKPFTDNSRDVGTSSLRPRDIYFGRNLLMTSGHIVLSSTAPTISSGFGTSPSIVANNGTAAFTINVGTGGTATNGVIGFPTSSTGWAVHCDDVTTQSTTAFDTKQTASTTTTASIGNFTQLAVLGAWAASDVLVCQAVAY